MLQTSVFSQYALPLVCRATDMKNVEL